MISFPNVCPPVVLASILIASLTVEVVSKPNSPKSSEKHNQPLSIRNGNVGAPLLVIDVVRLIENGKNGPDAIDP